MKQQDKLRHIHPDMHEIDIDDERIRLSKKGSMSV